MNKAIVIVLLIVSNLLVGQNFINGDLNGIIGVDILPTNWLAVPFNDINCQATASFTATPDLTHINGPDTNSGISGNPYSGSTFISGLHSYNEAIGQLYHEGIMQSISGFTIGLSYKISFYQSVVKQLGIIDTSGSWSVFIDNSLVATTSSSSSQNPYNSTSLIWEYREVLFTASSTTHNLKFLPTDDDVFITTDSILNGSLRMGLDSINLSLTTNILGINNHLSINLYPNPSSTHFTLDGIDKPYNLTIYNAVGQLLFAENNILETAKKVDVSQYDKGILFIRVAADDEVYYHKLIKN